MLLKVNGKSVEIKQADTVHDLLEFYKLQEKIVIVERNGDIVDRTQYENTPIADEDRIEIVHFVGGG